VASCSFFLYCTANVLLMLPAFSINVCWLILIRRNVLSGKRKVMKEKETSNCCLYLLDSWVKCHQRRKCNVTHSQYDGFRSSVDFFCHSPWISHPHGSGRACVPLIVSKSKDTLESSAYPWLTQSRSLLLCPHCWFIWFLSLIPHQENQMQRYLGIGREFCSF
jgi:hypothetical protein